MENVAAKLYDALEFVRLLDGELVRGSSARHEIINGTLHFFVDYNMFLRLEPALLEMENIDIYVGTNQIRKDDTYGE